MKITTRIKVALANGFNRSTNEGQHKKSAQAVPQAAQSTQTKNEETKQSKTQKPTNDMETTNDMKKEKARIYNMIIVDESGSMCGLKQATLSGINETINTIKSAQKAYATTQTHTLTLVTFDSGADRPDVRAIIRNKPIAEVEEFTDYNPWGNTPLYDAMGMSLTELHRHIKDDSDATAVVTVLTDGLENASKEWDATRISRLIEQLKAEGWSFSYMGSAHDVKGVADQLSIENVVEFSHDLLGAGYTWERERSSRLSYYDKMNAMYGEEGMSKEERLNRKMRFAKEYYGKRVAPDRIDQLEEDEIFVFGSNVNGFHNGGAAATAMRKFGAIWGQDEGLQGQSYAIPTMEGIDKMRAAISRFAQFAEQHREMRFLVTRIGCGIAGYTVDQVAPLFRDCIHIENIALPSDFWTFLGLKML